ncbi:hypothetical protein P3T21_006221 [Paraburkholderia sp. GAS334]
MEGVEDPNSYMDASVRMTHMGPGCTAGLCEKGVTFSLDYLQFFVGDDAHAKEKVGALIEQPGFFGIDLGLLEAGGRLVQTPGGPLPVLNLVKLG